MTDQQDNNTPAPATPEPTPLHANSLRLLPWSSPEGKPCFLSTDGRGGMVSRFADDVEEAQTSVAAEVREDAIAVLTDRKARAGDLRLALARVTDALGDVLRVAESRGARLPLPDDDDGDGDGDGGDSGDDQDGGPGMPTATAV
ncbi:hypothetical protein [Streptomyces sp. NPDC091212]|uniref:hypothetical protein n=1 Tax=Streptomyces sp. NPDC091212 TaxID=3155191 RepID=UPI0034269691